MAILNDVVFWSFLCIVVFTDLKYQKIYNWSTFSVAGFGIVFNAIADGFNGLTSSIIGLIVGLAMLGWVYRLGGCGGGDVKFLGTIGALKGYEFVIIGALWGFIIAGLFACIFLLLKGQFKSTWGRTLNFIKMFYLSGARNMESGDIIINMPYGVFLSIGMALWQLLRT